MTTSIIALGTPDDNVIAFSDKRYYKHTCDAMSADVSSCYEICEQKGAEIPTEKTSSNLSACINSINIGIIPSGNINITNTNSTNVTNYATAKVVDSNLVASNIITGKSILGIAGSAVVPSGSINISQNEIVDVTNYQYAVVDVQSSVVVYPSSGFASINELNITGLPSDHFYKFGAIIPLYRNGSNIYANADSITFEAYNDRYGTNAVTLYFYTDRSIQSISNINQLLKSAYIQSVCGEELGIFSVNVIGYAV